MCHVKYSANPGKESYKYFIGNTSIACILGRGAHIPQ